MPSGAHAGPVPHVYILRCADDSFYVGSTWDLERRVSEHNLGLGAAYTRRRTPVELVWAAAYDRVDEAYAMEKRIQGWSRAKRQALVDGRTDDLPGLASRSWAAVRARGRTPGDDDQVS
ncbi:hypothetical protein GCM10023339_69740 [Alloalcanivorax gelatiniphagus]